MHLGAAGDRKRDAGDVVGATEIDGGLGDVLGRLGGLIAECTAMPRLRRAPCGAGETPASTNLY